MSTNRAERILVDGAQLIPAHRHAAAIAINVDAPCARQRADHTALLKLFQRLHFGEEQAPGLPTLLIRGGGKRKALAADLAFRQSYAICPYSPEAIYRYINLLLAHNRADDAVLIAKTSLRLDPDNDQLQSLLSQLMKYR